MIRLFLPLAFFALYLPADQGLLPLQMSGIVYSPLHTYYAVATHHPTDGVYKSQQGSRLQIFNTKSGKSVWSTDFLGLVNNLTLADDGEHIVVVQKGILRNFYGDELTKETTKAFLETTVLSFYKREKLIKSYTVEELGLSAKDLLNSSGQIQIFPYSNQHIYFGDSVEDARLKNFPILMGHFMFLVFSNGNNAFFDIRSGEKLKKIPKEFQIFDWDAHNATPTPKPEEIIPESEDQNTVKDPFGFGAP
ncbi:hypothetical protein P0Y35_00840 [Kiritimatiellaeota bacterium B1221]|nr:hypothetical protein [Kiritimatiellaeota bacterium B1221]